MNDCLFKNIFFICEDERLSAALILLGRLQDGSGWLRGGGDDLLLFFKIIN